MWGRVGTVEARVHFCHYCGQPTATASRIMVSDVAFCRKSCVEQALEGAENTKDKPAFTPATITGYPGYPVPTT